MLLFSKDSCPIEVEKPQWTKFVMATDNNVHLYKEPSASSPTLNLLSENIDSDMCDNMYGWSDEPDVRGYSTFEYNLDENTVRPVLDEKDGWYQVLISCEAGDIAAWVNRDDCREVKPEPITSEVLDRVMDDDMVYTSFYLVEKGKLKNLCLSNGYGEFDSEDFQMGVLNGGVLYFPQTNGVYIYNNNESRVQISSEDINGYTTVNIAYGNDHLFKKNGEQCYFFDPQMLDDDAVQALFDMLLKDDPEYVNVAYYFPDADKDGLRWFSYRPGEPLVQANTAGDVDHDNYTTGYYVAESAEGRRLIATLSNGTEETGINTELYFMYVEATGDFDGDGDAEAIVQEHSGGSAGASQLYIVTYDRDSKEYVIAGEFDLIEQPVIVEGEGSATRLIQRQGIYEAQYRLENHQLVKKSEATHLDYTPLRTITCSELFAGNDEEGAQLSVKVDMNGDGNDDTLYFEHGTSHPYGFGAYMSLELVDVLYGVWQNTPGVNTAETFTILTAMTNGMHDLLTDQRYLYRWDGDAYRQWVWDGTSLVRQE